MSAPRNPTPQRSSRIRLGLYDAGQKSLRQAASDWNPTPPRRGISLPQGGNRRKAAP